MQLFDWKRWAFWWQTWEWLYSLIMQILLHQVFRWIKTCNVIAFWHLYVHIVIGNMNVEWNGLGRCCSYSLLEVVKWSEIASFFSKIVHFCSRNLFFWYCAETKTCIQYCCTIIFLEPFPCWQCVSIHHHYLKSEWERKKSNLLPQESCVNISWNPRTLPLWKRHWSSLCPISSNKKQHILLFCVGSVSFHFPFFQVGLASYVHTIIFT